MNFKVFISIALICCIYNQSLQANSNNTGTISGKILDKDTQGAIDFVNISLFRKDSKNPYQVKASDNKGFFNFTNIEPGIYRLETSLLGYLPYKKEVDITAGNETDLGEILMKADSKLLKSVEVTGIRSNMKLEIDKKVFSVDQSISSAGASASDILKDIPSVDVDAEGTISLRNSSSVTVWINGKPAGLTSDNRGDVLAQMPAESIDRIEVITNPSAKFSPEGSAGIINLILKKDRKSGYYGSIRTGVSYPWGKELGANINYSSSKVDAYASIGLRNNINEGKGYTNRQIYGADTSYMNSDTKRSFEMSGLFMRGGIDYHLNKKQTLSLSGFSMNGSHNSNSDIAYDYLDHNMFRTKQRMRNSKSDEGHKNMEITMDYLWEIGEGHSLQTNLTYGKRENDENETYTQTDHNPLGEITNENFQKQTGPSTHEDWEFQADYVKKFSENMKIEAGIKSDWTQRNSEDNIFNGAWSGNQWILPSSPDVSNEFDYNEQIQAAYGTFTGKISKFGYQLGLRGENTNVSFVSTDNSTGIASPKDKKYFKVFPTIFLNYNISKSSDIQLNYSKRINRPRGRSLNPFVNISDSSNIRIGNPDLNPEYADAFELNFIKSWTSHTLTSSIYHNITNNVIQDISYIDNSVMYQKPSNVTNATASGLEIVAKDRLSKMIETTSTVNFYHSTMDAFSYRGLEYKGTSGFSWNARVNGTLVFGKGLSGQVSGAYSAPRIIAQGESKGSYSLDLGLRKNFLDNKLQLSVNAQNVLNSFNFENKTRGAGFRQETSNQFHGRSLRLNLTWNFGNLKPNKKQGRDENNEKTMEVDNEY